MNYSSIKIATLQTKRDRIEKIAFNEVQDMNERYFEKIKKLEYERDAKIRFIKHEQNIVVSDITKRIDELIKRK